MSLRSAFDTASGAFKPHRREHWLHTVNDVDYTPFKAGENLADNAPHFWRWLTRAAGNNADKQARILAEIATMLAGEDNTTAETINNANITPRNPRKYLYHAYLSFMESHGHQKPISLTAFGKVLPNMMSEYGQVYLKGRTKQGRQTNLELKDESDADWLPKCEVAR